MHKFGGGNVADKLNANFEQLASAADVTGDGTFIAVDQAPGRPTVVKLLLNQLLPRIPKPKLQDSIVMVLVWQDGGTTDGDATTQCDRTYTARTLDATAIDTGGQLLGEDLTPGKLRESIGAYVCPPATGAGVLGVGYYDASGEFALWDANEVPLVEACT